MKPLTLILILFLFANISIAQNPSVIVEAKQYPSEDHQIPGTTNYEIEDWIHSNVIDIEGNMASSGFVFETFYWPSKIQQKFPAILKTDLDLNYIDEVRYEVGFEETGPNVFTSRDILGKRAVFQEIHEVKGEGYVAIGSGEFDKSGPQMRAFLVYLNYDLTPKSAGIPRVYDLGTSIISRFYGVRSYRDNGDLYFIVSGVRDGKNCIWKIDENADIVDYEYTIDAASNTFDGTYRGLCLSFPSGSLPDGNPVVENELPNKILATGFVVKHDQNGDAVDEDAILSIFDLGLTQKNYLLFDSDPTTTTGTHQEGYGTSSKPRSTFFDALHATGQFPIINWPCADLTDYTGSNYINDLHVNPNPGNHDFLKNCDRGHSIEQNIIGDGYVLSTAAHYTLIDMPNLCLARALNDQQLSAESVLHAIRIDGSNNITVDDMTHLAHLSGSDFYFNGRFDYDNNIYISSTIADDGIVLDNSFGDRFKNSMFLLSAKLNKTGSTFSIAKNWDRAFYGASWDLAGPDLQAGAGCSFDVSTSPENEIICVGNNHTDGENWDLIKFSDNCILNNPSLPSPDILPNKSHNVFSVKEYLDINNPGQTTLTFGNDKVVKAQIWIDTGYTLSIPYDWGNTIQFYDAKLFKDHFIDSNYLNSSAGIVVNGGTLILKGGAELTSISTSCFDTWGGVEMNGGQIIMENATISNSRVGLKIIDGNVSSTNTINPVPDPTDPLNPNSYLNVINFKNNNVGVWYPNPINSPLAEYKLLNFSSDDRTTHQNGMDYFIKFNGINLGTPLKVEGCSFTNSYYDNLGMCTGISSFGGSLDVLFASLSTSSTNCRPNSLRKTTFEGLYTGIKNGYTSFNPAIRMRVAESEFLNNKEAIIDGVGTNSLIWKNDIAWDANYPSELEFDIKLGVFNTWGWGTEILENVIENDHNFDFLAIYTEENAWDPVYGGHNVSGNDVTNLILPNIGTGHKISGDNSLLQVSCNDYTALAQDWYVTGDLENQGSSSGHNDNTWSKFTPPFSDISGIPVVNGPFQYYVPNTTTAPEHPLFTNPAIVAIPVPNSNDNTFGECPIKSDCDVYSGANVNWDLIAIQADYKHRIDRILGNVFLGDYKKVDDDLANLQFDGIYFGMEEIIRILKSANAENRLYNFNNQEVKTLKAISQNSTYTGQLAKDILFHFADIRVPLNSQTKYIKSNNIESPERNINSDNKSGISLFPNPANDEITITVGSQSNYKATIIDLNGKGLLHIYEESNAKIDISSLPDGLYFVIITSDNKQSVHKLVVH